MEGEKGGGDRNSGDSGFLQFLLLLGSGLGSSSCLDTVSVHLASKRREEVDQGEDICQDGPDGEARSGVGEAILGGANLVPEGQSSAGPELGDLHGSEVLLAGRLQADGGGGVVGVHDGVDERVEGREDPDGVGTIVETLFFRSLSMEKWKTELECGKVSLGGTTNNKVTMGRKGGS